jgi:hypothetical protein
MLLGGRADASQGRHDREAGVAPKGTRQQRCLVVATRREALGVDRHGNERGLAGDGPQAIEGGNCHAGQDRRHPRRPAVFQRRERAAHRPVVGVRRHRQAKALPHDAAGVRDDESVPLV